MPDCIEVQGIRAYGYVGLLPEEQVLGQWFEVHLTLWMDLSQAGCRDDIAETYDYRAAIQATQHLIRTSRFKLIEALADAIATAILSDARLTQVRVRLVKAPPIPDFGGTVTVDITRAMLQGDRSIPGFSA